MCYINKLALPLNFLETLLSGWFQTIVLLHSLCQFSFRSKTDVQTFSINTFCWRTEFMIPLIMASGPGLDAAKQSQTITLPPQCLYDVLFFQMVPCFLHLWIMVFIVVLCCPKALEFAL
ncbi:hypothetical protein ILYODFUR_032902 [Ilyodon furcidens]|uniref:Uncharacterized protein n=1 Tax=Ilyodon furcidens TaxID=33524 RepID=A0ABV0VJH3_9TELE